MKINNKDSVNSEISSLVNIFFNGKKITKGDIAKIKKMKNRNVKNGKK